MLMFLAALWSGRFSSLEAYTHLVDGDLRTLNKNGLLHVFLISSMRIASVDFC